jgi:hypothetical protein
MEKGEFELAQILLFPILKLVLSQPLLAFSFSLFMVKKIKLPGKELSKQPFYITLIPE